MNLLAPAFVMQNAFVVCAESVALAEAGSACFSVAAVAAICAVIKISEIGGDVCHAVNPNYY